MDGRDRLQKVGSSVTRSPGRLRRWRKFIQNPAHQLIPHLRNVALQYLGNNLLDNLLHFASVCHGQVSASAAGSGFLALHSG